MKIFFVLFLKRNGISVPFIIFHYDCMNLIKTELITIITLRFVASIDNVKYLERDERQNRWDLQQRHLWTNNQSEFCWNLRRVCVLNTIQLV